MGTAHAHGLVLWCRGGQGWGIMVACLCRHWVRCGADGSSGHLWHIEGTVVHIKPYCGHCGEVDVT